ncbi:3-alpha-(or 20-beta)-hydroxysteroid dehydrogenase [Geodia barretti]|uniref:3-ketoacyl-[acyl-carrier-protein] reductase beta subunit n=1 Tax=Geodia barretti TaxID=519541 RepID=A0AA35SJD6_GEOBA|nr:3-alpha-(or 20-beta)-hydroxysteroid dehydrogenase [Geodia barretti]
MRLEGKVALISGGARGQGSAEARLFAREGAAVVIGDILDEEGLKLEAEIRELGGLATYVHLDVTEPGQWESAVSRAVGEYGKLDILVNNAGIGSVSTIDGTSTDVWDRIMDVNSKGVFLGTKAAVPAMRAAGGGSIVNISSIAALVGLSPASGAAAAYAASKGSVRLLTKSTAVQYGREGIRCNSVHPGFIETAMTELRLSAIAETPIRRIGTVDDIANGVLFLASDESSFMTGSELVLDGGWTAQ